MKKIRMYLEFVKTCHEQVIKVENILNGSLDLIP